MIKYLKSLKWRYQLFRTMLKHGDDWDEMCKCCDHFSYDNHSGDDYGWCGMFDTEVELEWDYEHYDSDGGYHKKAMAYLDSVRNCKDCCACENTLWGKLMYCMRR